MNYLVFLDTQAGELEKILSGVKSMVLEAFDPAGPPPAPVKPGDCLYFIKDNGENLLRVKASVVRSLRVENSPADDLSHTLKEMQAKLQFTECQYNYWSAQKEALLIEFDAAHKISAIQIAPDMIVKRSKWIAFEEISQIV